MKKPDVTEMLAENRRRLSRYFRQYDANRGDELGEVTVRRKVEVEGKTFFLPTQMLCDLPGLEEGEMESVKTRACQMLQEAAPDKKKGARTQGQKLLTHNGRMLTALDRVRLAYDFEFWCLTCVKIQDKRSKMMIPFRLNYGQRKTVHEFEQQRTQGVPIRVIIVKARQWGGSTVTQMYMLWLQLYHYKRWHSAIVSQLKNQAINIRAMISNVVLNYPTDIMRLTLSGYEGLGNTKYIQERECKMQISSAETPDALRSFDFSMLHLSEVGLWKSTPARSAEDLMQALYATVPDTAGTFIVMESTAKGIGNFFHKSYLAAANGESMLKPVFVPWFEIENYAKFRHKSGGAIERDDDGLPVSAIDNVEGLIGNMTEYQWTQWNQGATLEGIAWYADTQRSLQYSDFMMRSEYPGSAHEAFQTKSNKYYDDAHIERCRQSCTPPVFVGNIGGKADKGDDALTDIRLTDRHNPMDELQIWSMPDESHSVGNRYLVVTDIGGIGEKSDWSVISVFDRARLAEHDGWLERAATWRGHIDHDQLAWKAAQVAKFYNNALLAIESNTLETKDRKMVSTYEGNHFYTVIDEIADRYGNMYMREVPPDVAGNPSSHRYGWHTNVRTKYLAYDQSRASIRDGEYVERDNRCVDEMSWLERKGNGSLGAIDGQHDDIIDTTAIGIYISSREMPQPTMLNRQKRRNTAGGGRWCNF